MPLCLFNMFFQRRDVQVISKQNNLLNFSLGIYIITWTVMTMVNNYNTSATHMTYDLKLQLNRVCIACI